jgi:Holliday junction resolvasome RuvABC endonuclease subunit
LLKELKPTYVYIEKSIMVRNAAVFRTLSYIVGALIAMTMQAGIDIEDIEPMVWKSATGYIALTRKFQLAVKKKLGPKAGNLFLNEMRKSQTQKMLDYNFPDFDSSNNNIADAAALALYGYSIKIKPIKVVMDKTITFDLDKLEELGLDNIL